jgi:hypothetical protein
MTDEMGRTVSLVSDINTMNYAMNTSQLTAGIYFVRINDNKGHIPAVRKIVIE